MEYKYIIYQTINLVNNYIYIGVHKTKTPYTFEGYLGNGCWKHKPSSYNKAKTLFQQALVEFGVNNFRRTTLEVFDTEEEAYKREAEIVNEEFISRDDVYNMILGGEMQDYQEIEIFQYDENGFYVRSFPSFKEASEFINVRASTVSQAVSQKIRLKNSFWSTDKVSKLDLSNYRTNKKKYNTVYMYAESGEFLKEFKSESQAAKELNVHSLLINEAAKLGIQIKEFYFSYELADNYSKARTNYIRVRPVYKFDSNKNFISEYNTQLEAETDNPFCNITKSIRLKIPDKNGNFWGLCKVPKYGQSLANKRRKVGRFDFEGNLLETWISGNQCMKDWGKGVQHCLTGKYTQHKGYIFKYID